MSVVFILGMVMTIVGFICSWNERYRATAATMVFFIGCGILFGFFLGKMIGA